MAAAKRTNGIFLSGLLSRNLPAFDGAKDDEGNGAVSLYF